MILSDNETTVDLLNNEVIATTIIGLLNAKPEQPVTIGVHGDWGAGKSSLLEMIEAGLSGKEDVLCLKFNGWRFQGFEDAKIALIEGIVTGLLEKRPTLTKAMAVVKDVLHRIDWLKVAKRVGGLALTAYAGIPAPYLIGAVIGSFESLVTDPAKVVTKENLSATLDGVKAVLKPGETKSVPEEVEAFRKAFNNLLKAADIKQLVVLIDDLDRCLPDTAIETLEAIRLFVFSERTAFVVAADEAMIEYAVRKHFPDLPDSSGGREYARNYLEKLIQVPFRIPALGETETRIYVTLLLAGVEVGENQSEYANLIRVAREKLKRPWAGGGLDASTVKASLGAKAEKANNALAISDQIGPILARGTKGNPRQVKRFLNTLLLRERTAEARGFGEEIKLPVLAKLMLAERFIPKLFEQIASASAIHPSGVSEDLENLERMFETADGDDLKDGDTGGTTSEQPSPTPENPILAEWMTSTEVRDWTRLLPKLSGIDLRPYLFVTKDKKDYFGAVSALGYLADVVEKLFSGKMAVQRYEVELRQLTQPEAERVFEAARARVMSTGTFDTKPIGVDGLIVLVKAQPCLQGRLIDFLEALPSAKCGPWAVGGWQIALRDRDFTERLARLLAHWGETTDNPALKAAARAALKDPKGAR